uniref:Uncharacterized protein n=1 Tax=Melopsittacus undulatus TaxID=13146 RepID=A0A8V5GI96_MELUD
LPVPSEAAAHTGGRAAVPDYRRQGAVPPAHPTPRKGVPGAGEGWEGAGLSRGERQRLSAQTDPALLPSPPVGARRPPLAMGLQPRRAAGPCPPAGRCAAWARGEEPEGAPGRTSLGGAPGETAPRFSLSLPPEAVRVLQRRSLERQRGQPGAGSGGRATPTPARRGARAGSGDLRALLKISLLNEKHRYDDEEYEEEEAAGAAVDEGLVRKCTEWLRGVESAAGRDRPDRLETLPHLSTL